MAGHRDIFYLFQIAKSDHLLIRVLRPGYSNARQYHADLAESTAQKKVDQILEQVLPVHNEALTQYPKLIGEFQGLPEGDELYSKHGKFIQNLWFAETSFGHPWIYLSIADDEECFWAATNEEDFADNGFSRENLIEPAIHLSNVRFVTENDVDLSDVPFHDVNNIE